MSQRYGAAEELLKKMTTEACDEKSDQKGGVGIGSARLM